MGKIIFSDTDSIEYLEAIQTTISMLIQNKKNTFTFSSVHVVPCISIPQNHGAKITETVEYDSMVQKPIENHELDSRLVTEVNLSDGKWERMPSTPTEEVSIPTIKIREKRRKKIPVPPKPEAEPEVRSPVTLTEVTDRAMALLNKGLLTLPGMHELVIKTGVENMGLLKHNPEALSKFNILLLEIEDVD